MPPHHDQHHHRPPGPPPPAGPGSAHWYYSAEKLLPLADFARLLLRFADSLSAGGGVQLRPDVDVRVPDPCETMVRFERTPKGHKVFKIELKWGDEPPERLEDELSDLLEAESTAAPPAQVAADGGESEVL
jgi:hypothetical protein